MTSPQQGKRSDGSYSQAWRNFTKIILPPTFGAMMRMEFSGQENFPPNGGVILAVNHLSYMDILATAIMVHKVGRYPVFLAKSSLFEVPVFGTAMRKLGQLPVYRGQVDAGLVLRDAERLGLDGACVIFYPEGTATRDPDQWPMVAKTGVARLALESGAPVIPCAMFNTFELMPPGKVLPRLRFRPGVRYGKPLNFSRYAGLESDRLVLRAVTDEIMYAIMKLSGQEYVDEYAQRGKSHATRKGKHPASAGVTPGAPGAADLPASASPNGAGPASRAGEDSGPSPAGASDPETPAEAHRPDQGHRNP